MIDKRKVRGLLDETIHRVRSDFAERLAGSADPESEEDDEEDET